MWSTQLNRSAPSGSGPAINRAGATRDTSDQGWESASLFQASSAIQERPLQATTQQHEGQRVRPVPFPESSSPAAHTSPPGNTAVVPRGARVTGYPGFGRPAQMPLPGLSSSHPTPRTVLRPSASGGVLQEQPHRETHQRPSPWQGRSPLPPSVGSTPAAFAGNRHTLPQLGIAVAVPSGPEQYPVGSHALYRAARVSPLVVQAPGSQQWTQGNIPQLEGTRAPALAPGRQSRFPAGTGGSSASPSVVFPEIATIDAATSAESQSSIGATASVVELTKGETELKRVSAGNAEKTEPPKLSAFTNSVDHPDLGESGKQSNAPRSEGNTRPLLESLHTSPLGRDSRIAEGDGRQCDVPQILSSSVNMMNNSLGGNMPDGVRRRPVLGAQQEQPQKPKDSTQARQEQQLAQGAVHGVSKVVPSIRLSKIEDKKRSLWEKTSRFYHEGLHLLQEDASDLVSSVHLPYLGPFDLMNPELAPFERLGESDPSGSTHASIDGAGKFVDGEPRLLSTRNGNNTTRYDDMITCGMKRALKELYAQAGSHLEQRRFRYLYCPTMAGTSALCCLISLLFFLSTVLQIFVRHLHATRSTTTSSSTSEAIVSFAPHGFAIGVLSLCATACVLLTAILSFLFFLHHLRVFHRSEKNNTNSSASRNSASELIPQEEGTPSQQTGVPSTCRQDVLPTVTERNQSLLVREYERVYTLCARGDLVGSSTRAAAAADVALKTYLDSLKLEATDYEVRQQSDKGGEKEKIQTEHWADHELHSTPAGGAEEKLQRTTSQAEDLLLSRESCRNTFARIVARLEAGGSKQQSSDSASFVQDVTDKNFVAYTTSSNSGKAGAREDDEAALVTTTDVRLRSHFLSAIWLNFWCAVTGALARLILTLLLSRATVQSGPSQWTPQQETGDVGSSWNTPNHVAADHLFPTHTSSSSFSLWGRLKAEWRHRGGLLHFLPQTGPFGTDLPALSQLPSTAMTSTATPLFNTLWTALNRLATFQMKAAGYMSLMQFVAAVLILQSREGLRLVPVVASTAAFLQLGVEVIEFICSGFDALTLLLGELFLKEILLAIVHLGGRRLAQLSGENFVARITCRSRLPATASTAAAAGALLANACSAHGAAATEVLLAEKRKKLRWGRNSILRHPSDFAEKSEH